MLRVLTASLLWLAANTASAITIDIPNYDFSAIITQASSTAGLNSNIADPAAALVDLSATSYVWTNDDPAMINARFGDGVDDDIAIGNGNGVDLSLFFVGGGNHSISLSLYDNDTHLGTQAFDSVSYTGYCIDLDSTPGCGGSIDNPIYVMHIDFSVYGSIDSVDRIDMDISAASSVPSLGGAYYIADSTVVPLPAPVLLMLSGLIALYGVARRK